MSIVSERSSSDCCRTWGNRLQNVYATVKKVLGQVGENEWEWSPDDGISSVREQALQIVKNADAFLLRYTEAGTRTTRPESISDARVAMMALEKIERSVLQHRRSDDDLANGSDTDDLFYAHLTYVTQKIAAVQVLLQLIEPSRSPVLIA